MKIVVLDGYTLNPGDLSWSALEKLGDCAIYDRTSVDEVISRAAGAEIALTNKTPITREMILRLPALRYIGVLATGYNIVDTAAAQERGITVTNVPTYGTLSVAQMVFAHLLNFTQNVAHHARTVREGRWTASPDFCYWDTPLTELHGCTMGIIGFGRIGRATAALAEAFGMRVVASDLSANGDASVQMVPLEQLLRESDVVSLHCPLTSETHHLINRERLALMKPTALLINTSRGALVDEQALADALNSGRIAGAGLDVLSVEPPPLDNPLLHAKHCSITPHIAWATRAARQRLLTTAVENVKAFLERKRMNVVV